MSLRPLGPDDLDALHALWTDPDVRRFLWDDVVISRDRAEDVLAASHADFAQHHYGLWAVHDQATGALAGFCGLRSSSSDETPELLYGFRRAWWGRGLATEAAGAVLVYAFETLQIPAIHAATDVPNAASMRLLERLGMTLVRRGTVSGLDTFFYTLGRERFYNRPR